MLTLCANFAETVPQEVKIPFVTKLVTGAVAGIIGTCCVFPIDIVKTRLQNQVVAPGTPCLWVCTLLRR